MTIENVVDVFIPAWGSYLQSLAESVASASGARITAIVEPADEDFARGIGCHAVVHRPPGGVGAAREAGLATATRPYVLFLDADDRLLPGMLERMAKELASLPDRYVAVATSLRRRSDGSLWPPTRLAQLCCTPALGPVLLYRNVLPAVGACLIRRSGVPTSALFPDEEDEDWHAVIRLRAHGRVRFTPVAAVDYNDAPGTVSRRPRNGSAVRRSHKMLIDAARGPWFWWWRSVEWVVRPVRRRNDDRFLRYWESSMPR